MSNCLIKFEITIQNERFCKTCFLLKNRQKYALSNKLSNKF